MQLYIDDRFLSFITSDKKEELIIREHFTFKDYSKVFADGSFDKRKIKSKCFITKKLEKNFVHSGFLFSLLSLCKAKAIHINSVIDKRTKFSHQKKNQAKRQHLEEVFPPFKYLEHQIDALQMMLKTNIGIIKAPTSAGKSEIIIAFLKETKLPALILVNRVSLAIQLVDRIKKNGIDDIGICHGTANIPGNTVVSTIQSIKKVGNLTNFKVLIIDEVHRACANTFQEFLKITSFPIRFGFSATPETNDAYKFAKIRQFMGDIIYQIEPDKLIEHEVIALPKIHFMRTECSQTIDWPSAFNRCIINNDDRNTKIKELVEEYDTQTLILVRYIEHGENLSEMINGSIFLSGIDDAMRRKETIERFEDKEINTIIATSIFNEGISINAIRLLIIASGGKSKIETIQRLGRALRMDKGKKEAIVYDFEDIGNRFTIKHSHIRKNTYKKAGFSYISK